MDKVYVVMDKVYVVMAYDSFVGEFPHKVFTSHDEAHQYILDNYGDSIYYEDSDVSYYNIMLSVTECELVAKEVL